jgi:hypothetical protein
MIKDTVEYKLISAHYRDKVAKRSQVPLMNHINEGLVVLDRISATDQAKRAFCLHPIVQTDEDLKANYPMVASTCDAWVVMLAIEYRSVANEFLSDKVVGATFDDIRLSPLFEVNEMLIADKIQNRKDFEQYHLGTHARSDELDKYFKIWLQRLGVSKEMYQSMCETIGNAVYTS